MKTLTDRARHEQGRPSDVSGENTQEHGSDSGQTPGRDHVNCNRKAENNCDFTYCTKILMSYC